MSKRKKSTKKSLWSRKTSRKATTKKGKKHKSYQSSCTWVDFF